MRNVTILAVVAMLALAVPAYGAGWDGGAGTDSYHDGLNWSGDVVPSTTTTTSAEVWDGNAVIRITETIPGGLMHRIANGHYILEAGTLQGLYLMTGYYADTTLTSQLTQTGGLLYDTNVTVGYTRSGIVRLEGGEVNLLDRYINVGKSNTYKTSWLEIVGTGPTAINVGSLNMLNSSRARLRIELDASGAVTPIQAGTAGLKGRVYVDDALATGLVMGDTVTIITTTGGITDNGLNLYDLDTGLAGDPNWTMSVGANDVALTYVPEPATLTLLGIGLVGVVLRRKRR